MHRTARTILAGLAAVAVAAAPTATAAETLGTVTIMVGSSPGGGWDQTARAMQDAMQGAGIARAVRVENVPGGSGAIALGQLVRKKGDAETLLSTGLAMVTATTMNKNDVTLEDTTPLARLTAEWQVFAVPAKSDIKDLKDLVARFKQNPGAVAFAGGAAGSADHVTLGLFAKAVGVDPARMNYVAHSGGGQATASVLGGHVTAGVSGYGEFEQQAKAGTLRIVAIASPARLPGIDVPTFKEQGVDLVHGNWRGVVAPPGLSDADRAKLLSALDAMVKSDVWKKKLQEKQWSDAYLPGDQFVSFVKEEHANIAQTLRSVGLLK